MKMGDIRGTWHTDREWGCTMLMDQHLQPADLWSVTPVQKKWVTSIIQSKTIYGGNLDLKQRIGSVLHP